MIISKKLINIYRSEVFCRCDDKGLVRYLSADDFDGLRQMPYNFKSSHGHRLKGWFYSYEGAKESPLVVFEHGMGGGHRSYMREIERLCRAGYLVFTYDHTGCMESGGEGYGGFAQSLCDLDDCLNELKADANVKTSDIYVVGHSWGGYSAMNICVFHPDVKKVVVMSGFVSVYKMIGQWFYGVVGIFKNAVYKTELKNNPVYAECDGARALKNAKTKALLIYSDNDKLVHKNVHYDYLKKELGGCGNVEFLLTHNKGHNPNYTYDAIKQLEVLSAAIAENREKLKTDEDKKHFRDSFDVFAMTEQDDAVWNKILEFLK